MSTLLIPTCILTTVSEEEKYTASYYAEAVLSSSLQVLNITTRKKTALASQIIARHCRSL